MNRSVSILGVRVDDVSLAETVAAAEEAAAGRRRLRIVTANPEIVCLAASDAQLRAILAEADLVTPDGVGVLWAARRFGQPLRERVTGIDLAQALFQAGQTRGWRVFLLGGRPGVAAEAAAAQAEIYPGLVFACAHGYFAEEEEGALTEQIRLFRPHLLLAGLGAPRQEIWLSAHSDLAAVSVGVGGAFDVLAGRKKRAPRWMQRAGCEWLYRLVREPERLKRQRVLPVFLWRVLRQRVSGDV
ncbi:MAG: WecB/TagA/CpsF family glycosyltransferase [Gracilibacteraceae bacterium]|jgi:N-acetylglucosaminyldiphosphoundecaprenol N-acetyl-beta-D-mannosaminyltransferase|nr:WecB/TagA/CpsF family glycosyltransferase [Gracilibacteraceae bacterium]